MNRSLRGLAVAALAYFVLLELMLVAAILYWPSFQENLGSLKAIAGPMPMLQDMLAEIEETGVLAYATGQHFFKGCNTLGIAAAVLFAVGAVAGEAHRGTLEIWLARPFSRTRLLTERYVAGALAVGIPVVVSAATIPILVGFVDEEVELGAMLLCSIHQWVFLMTIYGLTFLLSTLGSHPTRIALFVLFLSTFEFAIYMVKVVTDWSYFRLADIETFVDAARDGRLEVSVVLPLFAAVVVLYVGSLLAFHRRVP